MIEQVNFVNASRLSFAVVGEAVDFWDNVMEDRGLENTSHIPLDYLDEEPWFPQLVDAIAEQEGYDSKLRTILALSW